MPTDIRFRSIATLVLGGVGSRLDLSYEQTDDLQLAVLSVLEAADESEVALEVDADEGNVRVAIGPVRADPDDEALVFVLSRLVDEVGEEDRNGRKWLTLRLSRSGPTRT